MVSQIRLVQLFIFLYLINQISSKVEFTNIQCTAVDPEFVNFDYCFLKSVNRTYKYLSLKAKLFKIPFTKIKVNVEIFQKLNGYKPFLYNITVDACKTYLRNPKSNLIFQFMHNLFQSYSNMNHSCPYDHDIMLEKLSVSFIDIQLTKVLPVPRGDFMFHSNWIAYNKNRATVNVYASLS
ncbi:LOW QUALITY PROTEIN: uncharacterized protein LOC108110955 [Drosophila eugracilis]|uniref:LOW QUALITY PROTEIN: uncharacterized protein LOC108110955 n=1 Tax=Drosophila eugracilis TaxID=29029 RepID=UPI001BDA7BC3|nr:LOW QUALITY PROTEIN: uncharacterized protein LOC108110955 [Drosophila eugracilis]